MNRVIDSLAGRLRAARQARGLTQEALAERSDMKQPDVSKLEKGLMQQTTGIARLAAALGVSPAWLELGVGPDPCCGPWRTSKADASLHELPQTIPHG